MVVEEKQEERLKKLGINMKTKFRDDDKLLERNTDHSKMDNIRNGIIIEKDYYKDGILLKKENMFDSRITYSYEWENQEEITCKNCGKMGKREEFIEGCPYCNTAFNMEYQKKELGSKLYYDLTVKSRKYVITTYIIDLIVSFFMASTYILNTSRTFYLFDMLKIVLGTILISLLLFYVFFYFDAILILPSIKRKKEKENKKQEEFWKSLKATEEDKTKLFNNIHYSLRQYYYSEKEKNVVDFDIIDYNSYRIDKKDENLFIEVSLEIRIVRYEDNKLKSKIENNTYRFGKVSDSQELKGGENQIKCPNCGASIKMVEESCKYCGTKTPPYGSWYLEKKIN